MGIVVKENIWIQASSRKSGTPSRQCGANFLLDKSFRQRMVNKGRWQLICSQVTHFEIAKAPDESRRKKLQLLVRPATMTIALTADIISRAKVFETAGIKVFDAMHLACAETQADVLLTVDDRFLKRALTLSDLRINVTHPLLWLKEVLA